jgi:4,5-dihydroxyphthalate decarboxylase
VVRRDIVERYPWVVLNLYSMFLEAKQIAQSDSLATLSPFLDAGLVSQEEAEALRKDLFIYGVQGQREILETITEYSNEQGLTPRRLELEELFYPPTLEL